MVGCYRIVSEAKYTNLFLYIAALVNARIRHNGEIQKLISCIGKLLNILPIKTTSLVIRVPPMLVMEYFYSDCHCHSW